MISTELGEALSHQHTAISKSPRQSVYICGAGLLLSGGSAIAVHLATQSFFCRLGMVSGTGSLAERDALSGNSFGILMLHGVGADVRAAPVSLEANPGAGASLFFWYACAVGDKLFYQRRT